MTDIEPGKKDKTHSKTRPRILINSTSLFTDRILLFSSFARHINQHAEVIVWASSYPTNAGLWKEAGYEFTDFPSHQDFNEKLNVLREVCNTAWAKALPAPSLLANRAVNKAKRRAKRKMEWWRFLTLVGRVGGGLVSRAGAHGRFEAWLMARLAKANRSNDARQRLINLAPDLLVSTSPMWSWEAAVCIESQKLGIPVFSFIPSWDNITTKSRFNFYSKAYAVWSNIRVGEMHHYFPYTMDANVYPVGAPQYDVFYQAEYLMLKEDFFSSHNLDPTLPVVLYSLGSPLFITSEFGTATQVVKNMADRGLLEKMQVLIRPHPNKDNWENNSEIASIHPNVKIQEVGIQHGLPTEKRTQTQQHIADWVSTIKYSDVILAVSSTILLDGALMDKPLVNVEFDPTPGQFFDKLLRDNNRKWPHLIPLTESNACKLVGSVEETVDAIVEALEQPELRKAERKLACELILNNPDGKAGKRFAEAILVEVAS